MKKLEAITTVYSYRFSEIRKIIDEVTAPFPHNTHLKATNPVGFLDNFHEPIIIKILEFYKEDAPKLNDFKFKYPTMGSEEGIREIMTVLQGKGINQIYVLKGEYEGYKAVGETRKIETIEIDENLDPNKLKPGYFFISNPSARDGNIINNEFINNICDAGHKVFYDLAYLGSTKKHEFDLSHENIFSAVISFSKPYGMFYDRMGFTFSKEEVPSLYGNKWFKNIFNLIVAEKIVTTLKPQELYNKYRPMQEEIIKEINKDHGLDIKPSDALLLGNMDSHNIKDEQKETLEKFRRAEGYRFCLTPYYVNKENSNQ